jgi:hypothetical protein
MHLCTYAHTLKRRHTYTNAVTHLLTHSLTRIDAVPTKGSSTVQPGRTREMVFMIRASE